MKYAIVNVKLAEELGIEHARHKKSADKKRMVMNENELKLYGDPAQVAEDLDGELMSIDKIQKQINTGTWAKK